jgi:HK97 family phage major capsid protein
MTEEQLKAALDAKFKAVQEELAEAQKNNASKEEILKLHTSIKEQGQALEDFIESQKARTIESMGIQLEKFLINNKSKLEQMKAAGSGTIEFVPKAVGSMTTTSGGDIDAAPINHNVDLGGFNFRNDDTLVNLFSVTSTNSGSLAYTELVPKDGDYEFVAEGAVKPQIDFKWEIRYSTPKKIAAYEVLTEESVTDIPRLLSVGKDYLKVKHNLFKANALFFGDGIGVNAKGATKYGRTFVAGGMALKVTAPSFMDALNAAVVDISVTHNYTDEESYVANVALVNPVDFYLLLVSAKDGNGLPLYPQAGLFNTVTIGGLTIKPWEKIPAGKVFIGDMKKYNLVNYIPYSLRIGWINDQFITNQFTMVGESRFHAYVKKLDEQAFIYDDIATIKTAITKV